MNTSLIAFKRRLGFVDEVKLSLTWSAYVDENMKKIMRKNWVICGSGVSVIVAAELLGSAGYPVVVLNPGKALGGIFRGISANGLKYDVGMTNFEFDLFASQSDDILDYEPGKKSDIGRFVHFVNRYVERFTKVHQVPPVKMLFGDKLIGDFILSNSFDVLAQLDEGLRAKVIDELKAITRGPMSLHARNKEDSRSAIYASNYEAASIGNHGKTIHKHLIQPMLKKVLNVDPHELDAVFHRNGWVPLFYPETLLTQFSDNPQELRPTSFHYPNDTYFGSFVEKVTKRVASLDNVQVLNNVSITEVDRKKKCVICDEGIFEFDLLAWEHDIDILAPEYEFSKITSEQSRANLALFFTEVESGGIGTPFSVVTDPCSDSEFYRVTDQTVCSAIENNTHRIIFEANADNLLSDDLNDVGTISEIASLLDIDRDAVKQISGFRFNGALTVPNTLNMAAYQERHARLTAELTDIYLMGRSSGYIAATLNDHILQPIKMLKELGSTDVLQ